MERAAPPWVPAGRIRSSHWIVSQAHSPLREAVALWRGPQKALGTDHVGGTNAAAGPRGRQPLSKFRRSLVERGGYKGTTPNSSITRYRPYYDGSVPFGLFRGRHFRVNKPHSASETTSQPRLPISRPGREWNLLSTCRSKAALSPSTPQAVRLPRGRRAPLLGHSRIDRRDRYHR